MKHIKRLLRALMARMQSLTHIVNSGPGAWGLIVLMLALELVSDLVPISMITRMSFITVWNLTMLAVAALLRARRGAIFVWFTTGVMALCYYLLVPAAATPGGQQIFIGIGIGFLIVALMLGQLRSLGLRLKQAYTTLQTAHTELEAAHATIQKQALTDGLTGLPNHRAIVEQLHKEMERARRYQRSFSILFFDADRFKRINDTYGHATGDAVLQQIGERVARVIRGGDTLGRFGGEEFVLLLPEADREAAKTVAERIRAAVAAEPVTTSHVEGGLAATVSIGVATYLIDGENEQTLLAQADEAMYIAKRMGRNQVRTAEEARRIGEDAELMALLEKAGQSEQAHREGLTPEQLRETYTVRMISSLLSLLERRGGDQNAHAHAVSDLATAISKKMGLAPEKVSRVGLAALLHDIGMVAMPDNLLQRTYPLTHQEDALLREHTVLGAQILEGSPFLTDLASAVRHHHEQWNGNGFPDQLCGEDIPLAARIIAVAEAYDFLQQRAPSHSGPTSEWALAEVQARAGSQFDPAVVRLLTEVLSNQQEQPALLQEQVTKEESLSASF